MEEPDLIKSLVEGDEKAFRIIFEQNQKIVLNTCYKFVYNKEIAEDLTQEVFVEVFRSVKNFRFNSKLSTWIYRIAVSKSLDYLRAQKRKKRFSFLKSFEEDDNSDTIAVPNPGPHDSIENEDRIKLLNKALELLPYNQRAAFTLSKIDDLSYKEIADILETSVSSVESLMHRAKKNLEKTLYKYYKDLL